MSRSSGRLRGEKADLPAELQHMEGTTKNPPWPDPPGPYAYMDNDSSFDCLKSVGGDFSTEQKRAIIAANRIKNGGTCKSDVADDAHQTLTGSSPADDSPEIDHIIPRTKGGSNAYANAQVTSRKYNNNKKATYIG